MSLQLLHLFPVLRSTAKADEFESAIICAAVAPGAPMDGFTKFPLDGERSCVYAVAVPEALDSGRL